MVEIFDTVVGTLCYTAVVFVAGALIGTPMWGWMKTKMPWGK
jgi:hypothetical protein